MSGWVKGWGPAALVGLAAFGIYARTLAPTISWAHASGDGGDLITAIYTGGVPHPTGYPTYLLLGSLLTALLPGDPAYRLNLMSAAAAAGAVLLLTRAVIQLSSQSGNGDSPAPQVAGVTAGLALAFSSVLWSQAVVTEVYTLHALFFAALLLVTAGRNTLHPNEPPGASPFIVGAIWGVGLGNHLTLLLALPLILLATMRARESEQPGYRPWLRLGSGLALGLTVYLILPLRASAGPAINWGGAHTLTGLGWLVSGQLYHGYVFSLPLAYWPTRLSAWAGLLGAQFTWIGLAMGLFGLAWLARIGRGWALASGATFGLVSLFALGYNTTDSYILLLPAFVVLALWAGFGWAQALATLWRQQRRLAGVAAALGLAVPLWLLLSGYSAADASQDRTAVEFAQGVLAAAPSRAVLVSHSDLYSFVLWYEHYVRGSRPDIAIVDADLLDYSWYRDTLIRHEPGLAFSALSGPQGIQAPDRPVCQITGEGTAWRLDCLPASEEGKGS